MVKMDCFTKRILQCCALKGDSDKFICLEQTVPPQRLNKSAEVQKSSQLINVTEQELFSRQELTDLFENDDMGLEKNN